MRQAAVVAAILAATARPCTASATTTAEQPATREPAPATLPAVPADEGLASIDLVEVVGFCFRGNTAISDAELRRAAGEVLAQYPHPMLSLEQIERVRDAVTAAYVDRGYINSGAVLPDQTVRDGIITFDIVEGRLSQIDVRPVEVDSRRRRLRLREGYVKRRVARGARVPLNVNELRDALELLRGDPAVRRVNADLKQGAAPGTAELDVRIEDAALLALWLSLNNHHTVSTGAERLELLGELRNPTGYGDVLAFRYALTEGGFDEMDWAGLDAFSLSYTVPLTSSDTSLNVAVERSDEPLIEREFEELDITSESISYALTLRQPLRRDPNHELAVFASAAYRTNETTLLGERFPLSPGAEDGELAVTAFRFGAEYTRARAADALAVRSTVTIGTDWFGATDNPSGVPDSQFIAWLGQVQYVRRLGGTDNRLSLRAAAQLASDALPSLEQFSVGGFDTVRGYRENRLVRDSGAFVSAELLLPVPGLLRRGRSVIEVIPFIDAGYAEDRLKFTDDDRKFISSAGVGVVVTPHEHVRLSVFYGYPFQKFEDGDDLQDVGVHFDFTIGFEF